MVQGSAAMSASVFRLGLLVLCLITFAASNTPSEQQYVRPPPSPILNLEHLSLQSGKGGPHSPEQLHLALAGPGSIAVSWVTHPQVCILTGHTLPTARSATSSNNELCACDF